MRNSLFALFIAILINNCYSQEYGSALGIKSGYPGYIGINYKKNLDRKLHRYALDNMAGLNFDGDNRYYTAQLLFEINQKLGINSGFNMYGGIGPSVQYYTSGGFLTDDYILYDGLFASGDLLLGVEKFNESGFPINVAFEIGPRYTFTPLSRLSLQLSVALRYGFPENRKKRF